VLVDLPTHFFACFLALAHRFFAALAIAALPATDKTRLRLPIFGSAEALDQPRAEDCRSLERSMPN
jgi:hypothetical protein